MLWLGSAVRYNLLRVQGEATDGNSNLSGVTTEPGKMREIEGTNHYGAGLADQSENNVIFSSPSTSYKVNMEDTGQASGDMSTHKPVTAADSRTDGNQQQQTAGNQSTQSADNSSTLPSGKWGSVVVVKGGTEIGVFPMNAALLAIGSAQTNDIIDKTTKDHEAVIEVNQFGEIFLVDCSALTVRQLFHNDLFEVGGRALKWKERNVDSGEEYK